mmetsp:Transcript_117412/g.339451  ORF Transcript_117412/g.339451 Transcript_117412/m.339451 type:complete len:649 (+) Transcript_117412:1134-3080(+)
MLASFRFLGPLEPHLVEALLLGRDGEAAEHPPELLLREVLRLHLREPLRLLLVGERHSFLSLPDGLLDLALLARALLLLLLRLGLSGRLLLGLAALLLFVFGPVLALFFLGLGLLLGLLRSRFFFGLFRLLSLGKLHHLLLANIPGDLGLFLFEQLCMCFRLYVGGRLAHEYDGDALELVRAEFGDRPSSLLGEQIAFHLHDNIVTGKHRGEGSDHAMQKVLVDLFDAKVHRRLVVATRPSVPVAVQTALEPPLQHRPVAQLCELRVLLEVAAQPIEGAFVRQAHWEDDFLLAANGLLRLANLDIRGGGVLQHAALEGHVGQPHRPEVDLQGHVLVVHRREQRLALQRLRQLLRLAQTLTIAEQAHRVAVGARRVQVEKHAVHLVVCGKPGKQLPLRPIGSRDVVTLAVEGGTVGAGAEEQGGVGGGKSKHARLLGPHLAVVRQVLALENPHLVEVAPGLDPCVAARRRREMPEAAVGQGHKHLAIPGGQHVHRRVRRAADLYNALRHARPLVLRCVLLELLGLLGLRRLGLLLLLHLHVLLLALRLHGVGVALLLRGRGVALPVFHLDIGLRRLFVGASGAILALVEVLLKPGDEVRFGAGDRQGEIFEFLLQLGHRQLREIFHGFGRVGRALQRGAARETQRAAST